MPASFPLTAQGLARHFEKFQGQCESLKTAMSGGACIRLGWKHVQGKIILTWLHSTNNLLAAFLRLPCCRFIVGHHTVAQSVESITVRYPIRQQLLCGPQYSSPLMTPSLAKVWLLHTGGAFGQPAASGGAFNFAGAASSAAAASQPFGASFGTSLQTSSPQAHHRHPVPCISMHV